MGVSIGITIAQNSQSIANNTSNVTVAVTARWTYGSWNATGQCTGTMTIDGKVYTFTGLTFNEGATTSGSEVIMTKTVTVGHNADGTKTLSCSATFVTGLSNVGTVSASASKALTTIPRATQPKVGASVRDMGDYVTIYVDTAASTSFTHDLAYSFMGGAYQTIANGVKDWYNWTIPDLASQIPNATSGAATIRCITKNGSTVIGTKTVTMTLKVPASVVPTVSAVIATENTSGLAAQFGAFIQGKSTLAVKTTAAGAKGSTISSYKATLQGVAYTGANFTTGTLLLSGDHSLVVTVTDSRGRTASRTASIPVLPYTLPATSEFKPFRCDVNGNPADDGKYLSVAYAYSVASLGGKNTAVMVIEYKTRASSTWSQLTTGQDLAGSGTRFFNSPTFSSDYLYDLRMTVTDWFGASTTYTATLPTADVVLDISADGTGLGVGKVSQRDNATEFGRVMYDRFDTLINNGLTVYSGSGTAAIDPSTTLDHLIMTDKNTPTATFWYVMTLFYSSKTVTSNRVQYALPYSTAGSIWTRRYYSGAWSAWSEVPAIAESGTSGIWKYVKWTDGRVELTGVYTVSNVDCSTALGTWFRTAVLQPNAFPFTVQDPALVASYEANGNGAMLWVTTETTTTAPANYYLIRPTSSVLTSGKIRMRVTGRWR